MFLLCVTHLPYWDTRACPQPKSSDLRLWPLPYRPTTDVSMYCLLFYYTALLWVLAMSLVECPGCHKQLKSLTVHQKKCPDLLLALQQGPSLKRKHQEHQELERVKQRRLEEKRAEEQAAQERALAEEIARIEVHHVACPYLRLI